MNPKLTCVPAAEIMLARASSLQVCSAPQPMRHPSRRSLRQEDYLAVQMQLQPHSHPKADRSSEELPRHRHRNRNLRGSSAD